VPDSAASPLPPTIRPGRRPRPTPMLPTRS
jgi:hypothetical protein